MGKTGVFLLIHSPVLGSQGKCTQFVLSIHPLNHHVIFRMILI